MVEGVEGKDGIWRWCDESNQATPTRRGLGEPSHIRHIRPSVRAPDMEERRSMRHHTPRDEALRCGEVLDERRDGERKPRI